MVFFALAVIFIFSIILHEIAHGFVADWLGDPTARYSGRLTLNPLSHIDPVGSVIVPFLMWSATSALPHGPFMFGWAKPVPYNPYNLKNQRWGEALVGLAGPATNILLAVFFGLLIRFGIGAPSQTLLTAFVYAVQINLTLALFNLIPIPPLDGSKILRSLLPLQARMAFGRFEAMAYAMGPFGLVIVGLLAIYLLWPILSVAVMWLFSLITGV